MKTRSLLVMLTAFMTFYSCKDNNVEKQNTEPAAQPQSKNFIITISMVTKLDDSFQVYYKEDEAAAFEEKNSKYGVFKGSENSQDLVFEVPEEIIPNYLRFDFGINKEQKPIVISNIKISYMDKSFDIKGSEMQNYISFNDGTLTLDTSTGTITPKVSADGTYDPMSFTGQTMYDQIQTLLKQ